jgi:hypothetical protein
MFEVNYILRQHECTISDTLLVLTDTDPEVAKVLVRLHAAYNKAVEAKTRTSFSYEDLERFNILRNEAIELAHELVSIRKQWINKNLNAEDDITCQKDVIEAIRLREIAYEKAHYNLLKSS